MSDLLWQAILVGLMLGSFVGVCILAARERAAEFDEEATAAYAAAKERARSRCGYGPERNVPADTMVMGVVE